MFQQIFDHGLTDCGRVQEPQEIIERTSEQLSFDPFEGCMNTYTATRTTVDSQGNVLSGPEEFTGEEEVDIDMCCNEFAMGDSAFDGACFFDLETIREGYEFEDGQCKFVSEYIALYKLSTGETVRQDVLPDQEVNTPADDCCQDGITEACEDEPEPEIICDDFVEPIGISYDEAEGCRETIATST